MESANKWLLKGEILAIESQKLCKRLTVKGCLIRSGLYAQDTVITLIVSNKIKMHKVKKYDTIKAVGNLHFYKTCARFVADSVQ